jgi:hypothetical protein
VSVRRMCGSACAAEPAEKDAPKVKGEVASLVVGHAVTSPGGCAKRGLAWGNGPGRNRLCR